MGSSSASFIVLLVGAMLLALGANGHRRLPSKTRRGDSFDEADGRLSYANLPYHYNLELTPDIYRATPPFPFSGGVQIFFTNVEATNLVTLNSNGLTIDSSSVAISLAPGNPGTPTEPGLSSWSLNTAAEFLYITTTNPLEPGVNYFIEANFTGTIRSDGYGLYYDYYTGADGFIKYIATTQFEEHGARLTFPSFDEPDFKATFSTTIVRRPPAVSAGNTPLIETVDRGDGWVADVYGPTPKMANYLVAFAVGDLVKIPAGFVNGYEVNIWARPEIVSQMDFAQSNAPIIQAWLDHETGITYREVKSDHIALPDKGGAMENWGLITYGEQYFAYNIETSSAYGKQTIGSIQAHEMGHLWYGDLITCQWWDDIWLNEGFASYYDYRPTQALGWEGSSASQVDTQYFLEDDQRNSSDPVRKSIPTVWDAGYSFSGSTYPKGGAMVHHLEGILTTPTFKAGLTKHLLTYQYDTANTDNLWQSLTEQAAIDGITNPDGTPLDVKLRMDPWLNQMGFPLVSVTRNADGTATLARSHFLRPPNQVITIPSPYNYAWDVPITIASAETGPEAWDAAPSAWIDIGVSEAVVPGFPTDLNSWAVINTKFSLYYRVQYDDASQAAIVSQLLLDNTAIHEESRSQIIDDAFSIARAGYFPETVALETTRYLASEEKWGPWNAALRHLKYSDRLIRKQSWAGLQRSYILGLSVPVYERLGWGYSDTETPFQQFLRRDAISVGCTYGDANCLAEARAQYALIVPNPSANVVDPNNLPTVLCVGVYEGTEADWQLSFDQYVARKTSQIREERYAYLYGSACTNDNSLLDRLLVELGTSSVASRDRNRLAQYLSQREYGAQILYDYLDVNWNSLPSGIGRVTQLTNIALGFSTQAELDDLVAFLSRHPPTNSEETLYTNLILDVEANINWLNTEGAGLQAWLEAHQPANVHVEMLNGAPFALPVPSMEHWQAVRESYRSELNHF
jgi:aminopeptidase N